MPSEKNPRDVLVGENLTRLRGEMTQQALADAMRKKGWRWSQATVWSVEKGERPLKFSEAEDVAQILQTPLANLSRPTALALVDRGLKLAGDEVLSAFNEAVESLLSLEASRDWLASVIKDAEGTPGWGDEAGLVFWRHVLKRTLDAAVLEARARIAGEVARDDAVTAADRPHEDLEVLMSDMRAAREAGSDGEHPEA